MKTSQVDVLFTVTRTKKERLVTYKDSFRGYNVILQFFFMLSGRISRNIGENIFGSYTGTTSENTNFHVLVA